MAFWGKQRMDEQESGDRSGPRPGTMRVLAALAMPVLLSAVFLALMTDNGVPAVNRGKSFNAFEPADQPFPMPNLVFSDRDGQRVTLSDFAGEVVLLSLWATWCPACREEMPGLDRLQARLGGRGFEVIALSVDRGGRAVVQPYLARHNLHHLAIYLDPKSRSLQTLGIRDLPTSILIDSAGQVVGRAIGATEWDSPEALAVILPLLGPPSSHNGGSPGKAATGPI